MNELASMDRPILVFFIMVFDVWYSLLWYSNTFDQAVHNQVVNIFLFTRHVHYVCYLENPHYSSCCISLHTLEFRVKENTHRTQLEPIYCVHTVNYTNKELQISSIIYEA